jgi:hypothetical protein
MPADVLNVPLAVVGQISTLKCADRLRTIQTKFDTGMMVVFLILLLVGNAMAMEEEIVGTVMQNGDNYALLAHSGEYLVVGKNLKNYVGDTVAASGKVYIGAKAEAIRIDSVRVIAHKDLITQDLRNKNTMS